MILTIEEAKGFAAACEEYSHGVITPSRETLINSKEETERKEELPPTPPIGEKKGKEERSSSTPPRACVSACVRTCVKPATYDLSRPPTLVELKQFAHSRGYDDDTFIEEWFDMMQNELFWLDPNNGRFIHHWVAYFRRSYLNSHSDLNNNSQRKPYGPRNSGESIRSANANTRLPGAKDLF